MSAKRTAVKKPRKKPAAATLKRGRRSDAERTAGRWRLSIREITETKAGYSWRTYLVQGWKDETGRWARKRFRDRQQAEAFMAVKRLEVETRGDVLRPIVSRLTQAQAKDAETALDRLAALAAESAGTAAPATLCEAVEHYARHWRASVSVEAMPFRDARRAIVSDKERAGRRARSVTELDISLRAFERWLLMQPRYTEGSVDTDWTPPVHEIGRADVAAYLDSLRSRAGLVASPKTRNNIRGDLHGFFDWCRGVRNGKPLPGVTRRWCVENPVADIAKENVRSSEPQILSIEAARALMRHVEKWGGGRLAPFFSLAAFAGLRPGRAGELRKLAVHPDLWKPCKAAGGRPLIDLERGILTVPAEVSKTGRRRIVTIQPNLRAWLERFPGPILPDGAETATRRVRGVCSLAHDVCRHSFISYLVGLTGSKARAALEAGNSERVIDKHYLHIPTAPEAREYFAIMPTARLPSKTPGAAHRKAMAKKVSL